MKAFKKIALLATAVIAPALLGLTSCSDDDDKTIPGPAQVIEGTYTGMLSIEMGGESFGEPSAATISIKAKDINNATLNLDESSLSTLIEGGKVTADVIAIKDPTGEANYGFAGDTEVALVGQPDTKLDVEIIGVGTPTNMTITIHVDLPGTSGVEAVFTGSRK